MKRRPKQHQLEDKSRAKFQLSLPENWVFRDKDKDYGIDGEVELFDKVGQSQGLMFYVQLKATSSNAKAKILNVDFKVETLHYFNQLDIPVLLARYSEQEDKFYIRWVNNVDLTFSKKNAKTFRVKLSESIIWNDNSATKIENSLSNVRLLKSGHLYFPFSYSIYFDEEEIQGLSNRMFKIELRNKLNEYSDFLEFKKADENPIFKISLKSNVLLLQPSILPGVYLHNINKRPKDNFIQDLSNDILIGIATSMVILGHVDIGGRIIFENELEINLLEREELFMILLPHLLMSAFFEATLKTINDGFDVVEKSVILMPSVMTMLLQLDVQGKKKKKILESFFKRRLKKAEQLGLDTLIATSYYNLGNFYKNQNKYNEVISCYVQAKKQDKNYLKRPYFYAEFGGVLFSINKYKISAKFYCKAIKMGANLSIKRFYADALMFTGEYEKAFRIFDEYLSETIGKPDSEFALKALLLEHILNEKNITFQNREINEANLLAGKTSNLKELNIALEKDLLSSLAWFNIGMTQSNNENYLDSTISFSMCAVINLWDIEAWVFAFLSFLNSGKKGNLILGSFILVTGYRSNGDEFLKSLITTLEKHDKLDDNIIEMIDNYLIEDKNGHDTDKVIRILKGESYKEIDLNLKS